MATRWPTSRSWPARPPSPASGPAAAGSRARGSRPSVIPDAGSPWPGRVGKTVKGMFVALALVVALEREPEPLPTLLALIGAVLAFLAGELYEAVMEARLRHRRALLATEFREIAYEQSFIAAGALPSIVIFSCAAAGLLSTAAA